MPPKDFKLSKKWFEYANHDIRVAKLCLEQPDEAFLKAAAYPDSIDLIGKVVPLNKYVIISRYPMDEEIKKSDILKMLPLSQNLYEYFFDKLTKQGL